MKLPSRIVQRLLVPTSLLLAGAFAVPNQATAGHKHKEHPARKEQRPHAEPTPKPERPRPEKPAPPAPRPPAHEVQPVPVTKPPRSHFTKQDHKEPSRTTGPGPDKNAEIQPPPLAPTPSAPSSASVSKESKGSPQSGETSRQAVRSPDPKGSEAGSGQRSPVPSGTSPSRPGSSSPLEKPHRTSPAAPRRKTDGQSLLERLAKQFPKARVSRSSDGQVLLPLLITGAAATQVAVRPATSEQLQQAERLGRSWQGRISGAAEPGPRQAQDPMPSPAAESAPTAPAAKEQLPASVASTGGSSLGGTLLAIEVPRTNPSPTGSATSVAQPTEFVLYDPAAGQIVGDEVYESASRPRNEEKIQVGERELIFVRTPDDAMGSQNNR